MLVLTAFIWGSSFVAQSVGVDYIGPYTFNSVRCFLGGLILIPVIVFFESQKRRNNELVRLADKAECDSASDGKVREQVQDVSCEKKGKKEQKTLLIGGLCCGLALAVASALQTVGIVYTTAGKAGFVTALYILIVPVMGLFLGRKAGVKTWIGVALALVGMYCLCITEGFAIGYGDFLVFLCAIVYAIHILVIDYFSPKVDGVKMSCIQFFVSGLVCAIPMFLFEQPSVSGILAAWLPLAYAGFLSCGVAYTLQIVAQKHTDPTVACLIMSLESVFAVLSGWLVLNERLTLKEGFGCALVFAAIILAQLPDKTEKSRSDS